MMIEENQAIKREMKAHGLYQWQVALHIGVSDQTLLRWLRVPLTDERRARIRQALNEMIQEA